MNNKGNINLKRILTMTLVIVMVLSVFVVPGEKVYAATETEPNENYTQATYVPVGVEHSGKVSNYNDKDWYEFTVSSDGFVNVDIIHDDIDAGSFQFHIVKAGKTDLASSLLFHSSKGINTSDKTPDVALTKGTYYLVVKASRPGNYKFKINYKASPSIEIEHNDSAAKATTMKFGTKYYASIVRKGDRGSLDEDWYKVDLSRAGTIKLNFHFGQFSSNNSWTVIVYDANRTNKLFDKYYSGQNPGSFASPDIGLGKGTYYIKIKSWSEGQYDLSVKYTASDYWEMEPNDTVAKATKIQLNKKYNGSSKGFNDRDYYLINLPKDETITVSLGHSYLDGYYYIDIYDGNKNLKQHTYVRAELGNPYTTQTVNLKKGTNYVRVTSFSNAANGKTYSITVNTGQKSKISIKNATVTGLKNKDYTGKPVTQNPTVTLNGKTLKNGTDYVLSYRNNVASGYATIYITGKGNYVDSKSKNFRISGLERIYGDTRYATGTKIATRVRSLSGGGKFKSIVVADGTNFPDALAGTYLAKVKGGPVLLTNSQKQDSIVSYIRSNLATGGTVYVLGGTVSVPSSFTELLRKAGIKYVRRGGKSRYDTNSLTLETAGIKNKDILVCTGENFPDALVCSATGRPILIVHPVRGLSESQKKLLSNNKVKSVTIMGGTGAVPKSIENQLRSVTKVSVNRISARNRYELSIKAAEEFFDAPKEVALVTGLNFADALTGGPLAIKMGSPLLLVGDNSSAYTYAKDYIKKYSIKYGVVLGGPKVVSDETINQITKK